MVCRFHLSALVLVLTSSQPPKAFDSSQPRYTQVLVMTVSAGLDYNAGSQETFSLAQHKDLKQEDRDWLSPKFQK